MAYSKALGALGHETQAMDSYSCRRHSVRSACASGFRNVPAFWDTILIRVPRYAQRLPNIHSRVTCHLRLVPQHQNSSRLPFVHIFPSDCVDAATKLDDIDDIVLVHFNFLIEPAAPTKGTSAFAVSIMGGYRLGVYGKNL